MDVTSRTPKDRPSLGTRGDGEILNLIRRKEISKQLVCFRQRKKE